MSGTCIIAEREIVIGNNVLIGANVKIFDSDFHPSNPYDRINNTDFVKRKPVKIGNNVFIGINTIIQKGVTIGNNCTINSGSIVVNKVPDNAVVAGNPAKVLFYYTK